MEQKKTYIKLVSDGTPEGSYLATLEGEVIENVEIDTLNINVAGGLGNIFGSGVNISFKFIPIELNLVNRPITKTIEAIERVEIIREDLEQPEDSLASSS